MPATVLVADDDADMLLLVGLALEQAGHTVIRAGDGATALAIAEQHRPDLILSDVKMLRLSGVELAARFRGRGDGYSPPILLMSAAAPAPLPERVAFLPKPFTGPTLLREIASLLAG